MGFKFVRTPYNSALYKGEEARLDGKTVTMELDQDITLPELLEAFEAFLRASGYSFDGTVDIIPPELPETELLDPDFDDEDTSFLGDV